MQHITHSATPKAHKHTTPHQANPRKPDIHEDEIVLNRIGILSGLVVIGYASCFFLFIGPLLFLGLDNGFFVYNEGRVAYISDSFKYHPGYSILAYGTGYSFLWGASIILCWLLRDPYLFWISTANLFAFHGTLGYKELNGPEHIFFVTFLLISHAYLHDRIARSRFGFALYEEITTITAYILAAFFISWIVSDVYYKRYETQVTTLCLELILWGFAAIEYTCMLSIIHGSDYVQGEKGDDIIAGVSLRKQQERTRPSFNWGKLHPKWHHTAQQKKHDPVPPIPENTPLLTEDDVNLNIRRRQTPLPQPGTSPLPAYYAQDMHRQVPPLPVGTASVPPHPYPQDQGHMQYPAGPYGTPYNVYQGPPVPFGFVLPPSNAQQQGL